ncbi:MAG: YifB family Mg chelatase-like AAA ATPase, partial [Elusimicrobiota bacterium]
MATNIIYSACPYGIDARLISVEVDVRRKGIPAFALVGLPDTAVKESRERVLAAIRNTGFAFPSAKITVNLAPADFKKEGVEFDLPIALGILVSDHTRDAGYRKDRLREYLFAAELGLDGALRRVRGTLAMALCAKAMGLRGVVVACSNAQEAALIEGVEVIGCQTLREAIDWILGRTEIAVTTAERQPESRQGKNTVTDFADIAGNSLAKKALEVAAAGGHHMLMTGPPGSGKTLLARAMAGILPALNIQESLGVMRIYSAAGLLEDGRIVTEAPVRSPHHGSSFAAMVGGGVRAIPGEAILAHNGILFLDEMPEFRRDVLEALRQPLEEGKVVISRALSRFEYPCRFILIAAANPCPCGWWRSRQKECQCGSRAIERYQRKFSGPLLDRMDIRVEVDAHEVHVSLLAQEAREGSAAIRERVARARAAQIERFAGGPQMLNAHMGLQSLKRHCKLREDEQNFLGEAMKRYGLTARAYHRVLKTARTIADLAQACEIAKEHLAMALKLRL